MKLSEFVVAGSVIPELEATDRDEAVRELVASLVTAKKMSSDKVDVVTRALLKRENKGTTGFGRGIAVPHLRVCPEVTEPVIAIGRTTRGVDFTSLDARPVHSIVLLLIPPDHTECHLQCMEKIFLYLKRDNFRRFLQQADTVGAIMELFREMDEATEES